MERYKRTKSDSVLRCPYCGRQFNNGMYHPNRGYRICKGCNKEFYYINYSKAYCDKTGKKATYTLDEIEDICKEDTI